MRKLRRFCSALLAFSIFLIGCGGQFASASSEIIPFSLPQDNSEINVLTSLYYGSSSSNRQYVHGRYSPSGSDGNFQFSQLYVPTSTQYYLYAANSFYVEVIYNTDNYYMDSDKVDVILEQGTVTLNVLSGSGVSEIQIEPYACVLLINNSFVGDTVDYEPGSQLTYSYDLTESNNTVTSYGVRYQFKACNLSASGVSSNLRILSLSAGDSDITFNEHLTEQGLFSGLFEWLGQIKDGITDLGSSIASGFTNVVNAVTSLPGLIVDGIKNLFIPSEDDLTALQTKYEDMLEQKLGFIWQAGTVLTDFANTIISGFSGGGEYAFEFPGISVSLPSGSYTIVEAQSVSMDNAFFDVVRPVAGTGVSIIAVIGFVRIAEHMLTAVVSGASYFEFLTKKEE